MILKCDITNLHPKHGKAIVNPVTIALVLLLFHQNADGVKTAMTIPFMLNVSMSCPKDSEKALNRKQCNPEKSS